MEHKAVHIITSLRAAVLQVEFAASLIDVEAIAEDQEGSKTHTHAYITWPVGTDSKGRAVLKPKKENWIRGIRRRYGCEQCKYSNAGKVCTTCGIYIWAGWPKTPEHVRHLKRYIAIKPGAIFRDQDGNIQRCQHEQR